MCRNVILDRGSRRRLITGIPELHAALGVVVIADGYGDIDPSEDQCLCPVDIDKTAAACGAEVKWLDDGDVVLTLAEVE